MFKLRQEVSGDNFCGMARRPPASCALFPQNYSQTLVSNLRFALKNFHGTALALLSIANIFLPIKIRQQHFRNFYLAIFILKIFHDRNERSTNWQARTINRM